MSDIEDDAFKIASFMYDNKNIGAKYIPVIELKRKLNLSEEDFNVADVFLLESRYCMGTMGGDSGQRKLTPDGVAFVKINAARKVLQQKGSLMGTHSSTIDIFISHSSQDVRIAQSLITLLRSALNIPASHIRCTSVEGYKFDAGISFDEQIGRAHV